MMMVVGDGTRFATFLLPVSCHLENYPVSKRKESIIKNEGGGGAK